MTNEEIKESLLSLANTNIDFTVILSGKQSNKVNGLYKPDTQEIILHSLNFKNDNQMIYTAIHEYAHHLINEKFISEKYSNSPLKNVRSHNTVFWATFHNLLDIAIEKGVYKRTHSEKTQSLITEVKEIDNQIAQLQKELGNLLIKLHKACEEENTRFEDVVDSELVIKRATAKKCQKMTSIEEMNGLGQDAAELVIRQKNVNEVGVVIENLKKGKSIDQIKNELQKNPDKPEERLLKEKSRIEKVINQLQNRLEIVLEQIKSGGD